MARNVLLVSRYSGYSLYNNSSTSANVLSPQHGIAKHIFWSFDIKLTHLSLFFKNLFGLVLVLILNNCSFKLFISKSFCDIIFCKDRI